MATSALPAVIDALVALSRHNLIPSLLDGTFETTENWSPLFGSDEPTRTTDRAYSGDYSLYVRRGSGSSDSYARRTLSTLLPAAGTYTASGWLWLPSSLPDADYGVKIFGSGTTADETLLFDARDEWTRFEWTFEWDGAGTVVLDAYGTDNAAEMWLDDIRLVDEQVAHTLVLDGFGLTDDPGDFLMIGAEDPDRPDAAVAFSVSQGRLAMGGSRLEHGVVNCVALSWNGDADQKAARDACFAIVAEVEAFLRSSPTLGLAAVLKTEFAEDTSSGYQSQGETGAACWVPFSIAYQAQI